MLINRIISLFQITLHYKGYKLICILFWTQCSFLSTFVVCDVSACPMTEELQHTAQPVVRSHQMQRRPALKVLRVALAAELDQCTDHAFRLCPMQGSATVLHILTTQNSTTAVRNILLF